MEERKDSEKEVRAQRHEGTEMRAPGDRANVTK